jgi:hypothetical protein
MATIPLAIGDDGPKKPAPGLTGADLEQAKAEAELAAANKAVLTAKHRAFQLFPPHGADDALHAGIMQAGDAASNLANLAFARHPEADTAMRNSLDALRARTAVPLPVARAPVMPPSGLPASAPPASAPQASRMAALVKMLAARRAAQQPPAPLPPGMR